MKRKLIIAINMMVLTGVISTLASFAFSQPSSAVQSVPYQMNFQGRLNDSTGAPMPAGTYNMTFRIYSASSGGTLLWSEVRSVFAGQGITLTSGGLFSTQLGINTSLPPSIFNSANKLYLEVELPTPATATCGGSGCASYTEGAMTPRNPIASSPFAMNSDLLDGLDSSAFAPATGGSGYIQTGNIFPQAGSYYISGSGTIEANAADAFSVQDAGQIGIFKVDTISGQSLFGTAGDITGQLVLNNWASLYTVSLQAGTTTASYTLTLPTSVGSTGQCLATTNGTGTLGWSSCGGGGGGSSSKTVVLTPEYAGAVLRADGSNNNGTIIADFTSGLSMSEGYKHNYYQWTTSQATTQDYDVVVTHQLPSDFNASTEFTASSWKIWTYVDNTTDAALTMTVYDNDMTACANGVSVKGGSTGWQQITLADFSGTASCDFTANSVITISVKMSSKSPSTNKVRIGAIQYGYST